MYYSPILKDISLQISFLPEGLLLDPNMLRAARKTKAANDDWMTAKAEQESK